MKTISSIIMCLIFVFGVFPMVHSQTESNPATTEKEHVQLYTCGMHPQVISDKPGVCPICNMKLIPKRDAGTTDGTVKIDPITRQNMGLVTDMARYAKLTRTIHAFGEVAVPDPNVYSVTVKFDGWAERLFVNEEGEQVFKGAPLLEVYSPDLVTAQKEYLVAIKAKSNPSMARLAESARSRLLNYDISEDQLVRLEQTGEVTRTMIIRSPADGFVKAKHVNEGDRVTARSMLYQITNLEKVWIKANVYEQDLPYLRLQQRAGVSVPSLPGKMLDGTVNYISPHLDEKGQVEIRLTLDNVDFALKPAMYADVTIDNTLKNDRLVIPRSAVINSGLRQFVYVTTADDTFEPREIMTGAVGANDMIEVVDGLQSGEGVVTSGQFLLDSETRLNESMTMATGHNHGAEMHMAGSTTVEPMDKAEMNKDPYDIYTCPMPSHYHVLQFGPGKCPECGMNLVPVKETDNTSVYVCPMPSDSVVSHEPGLCPKCNMKLIEYRAADSVKSDTTMHDEEMHHQHGDMGGNMQQMSKSESAKDPYDIHTCPMPSHFHVLNYGPGTCNECGMKLVPVSQTDNAPIYVCPMPSCKVATKKPGDCPVCNMHLVEYKPEAAK